MQKTHKIIHEIASRQNPSDGAPSEFLLPNRAWCGPVTPLAENSYNPFPSFGFSGPLRPVYPLSPKRVVPDHIPRPDYAEDGSAAFFSPSHAVEY
jgi:methionyl aminopeptidase